MLTIAKLCIAIYASGDHVTAPEAEICFAFAAPVVYDVAACPGEVTTPADDWSIATCEISREE